MSTAVVQALVDALAERLQRQVTVEDHTLHLVAFSRHYGDADTVRIWSLMERRSRPDEIYYAELRQSNVPVRVPAVPEVDQHARLCTPIRHQGALLGFMWVIDRDHSLTGAEIADIERTATSLGNRLHELLVVRDTDDLLAGNLLDKLAGNDATLRSAAAAEVLARGYVYDDSYVGVLALSLDREAQPTAVVTETVADVLRKLPPRTTLRRVTPRAATIVVGGSRDVRATLTGLGEDLAKALTAAVGDQVRIHIGVSDVGHGLGDVAGALRQASLAVAMSERLQATDVQHWDDLGPYQLIAQLPADAVDHELLPRGLVRLLRAAATHELVTTAEAFLDCGGDKQQAARKLNVHRSTMYYRLERVAAITGLDLADGSDRLLLHMAIKLHRLAREPEWIRTVEPAD